MHRIDGPGATVDNKFTDGDPVGGIQATMVTDDWANDVQEELMSVLTAGGVAPVKGTQDQVLTALTNMVRTQKLTAFTTAGAAPAFTLTPSPAIAAYATNQRFRVRFNANGNGSDTLNVSGKGAKSLKQYSASGAKVAAVIAAGVSYDVEYDGTDMVVAFALPPKLFSTSRNVIGSRAIGSTYTNISGNPIMVNVGLTTTGTNQSCILIVDDGSGPITMVGSSYDSSGRSIGGTFLVPAGATYRVPTGSYTLSFWSECA